MSENEEFVREFLDECAENLDQLDQDLVALEEDPQNADLLDNIFRTIHTIKGTSGFFGFAKLGAVAHDGESLLGRLRGGELILNQEITTALLKLVDAIRSLLSDIDDTGQEGASDFQSLSAELIRLALSPGIEPSATADIGAAVIDDAMPAEELSQAPLETLPPTPVATSATAAMRVVEEPSSEAKAKAQPEVTRPAASEGSIRVDVGLLDDLVDLAGELVLARNQLNQFGTGFEDRALTDTLQKLSLITSDLQESVLQTRMQPMSTIWGKFPRVVRDLAVACKKEVRLEQSGEETELDRSLLEAIKDPLTHLIRNAVDHGIELPAERESCGKPRQGCILLRAYHESGQVHIEISDDGGGIDVQRVKQRALERGVITESQADTMSNHELCQLIFRPGFSTAEKVTGVSGRGVGMDVVRTNIEQIGGAVDLQNRPGMGTTVRITIPLTLAIIPALIVTSAGERFAVPQASVTELLNFKGQSAVEAVEWVHNAPVHRLRGQLLPLVYLNRVFELTDETPEILNIVVLRAGGNRFGLVVDAIVNTEEIVVKPIGRALQNLPVFAGATIMGDGRVALILDVTGLGRQAGITVSELATDSSTEEEDLSLLPDAPIVLCEVGTGNRVAIRLEDVERLKEFPVDQIERAAGKPVVRYGDRIMPLIHLSEVLEQRDESFDSATDSIRVVVGRHGEARVGLAVSRIVDIVPCPPGQPVSAAKGCVAESVVIAGCVTDVIDLERVLCEAGVA